MRHAIRLFTHSQMLQRPIWMLQISIVLIMLLLPVMARAYEIDLELPVAPSVSGAGPDLFTGTMGARIPIEVPKGTRGVEPNLALVYRGGNGNGPTGLGWKLDMGGIERQSRSGVNFNGNEYVLKLNGVVTDLVPDPSVPDQYRPKIEGTFLRIMKKVYFGTPYWEVTDQRGTVHRFGLDANARQADPADATKIFRWNLDWVIDRGSNNMLVSYVKDQGQLYLDQIHYTGFNYGSAQWQGPIWRIEFKRSLYGTPTTLYTAGFPVTTRYVISAISAKGSGQMIRTYALAYTTSPQSGLPLLQTVTQYGKDAIVTTVNNVTTVTGSSLPPTTLAYSAMGDG